MAVDLLTALRTHLAAEGIVRPKVALGPADLPPLHLERDGGVPAPGEGQNPAERHPTLVLGARVTGGIPPRRYESWQRRKIVDVTFRAKGASGTSAAATARPVDEAIAAVLVDRRDWMMDGLHVIECLMFNEFARTYDDPQAANFRTSYVFQLYAAGTPG